MREDILDGIYKKLESIRDEIADKIDAVKVSKESYIFNILETKDEISLEDTPEIEALEAKKFSNVAQAYTDLLAVCDKLKKVYPNLTPRLLDHTIWSYIKKKEQNSKKKK